MKALFLDRDGIINTRIVGGYVSKPADFEFIDDILPVMSLAKARGYQLVMISNQQGVGKGLMTSEQLVAVHDYMQNSLRDRIGFSLDALYYCTDLDTTQSFRRKPQPGMLLEAIEDLFLDPRQCWFIGDSITDSQAGRAAAIQTILVGSFLPTDATLVVPTTSDLLAPLESILI